MKNEKTFTIIGMVAFLLFLAGAIFFSNSQLFKGSFVPNFPKKYVITTPQYSLTLKDQKKINITIPSVILYTNILNYPSLSEVKTHLQNETVYLPDNSTINGYDTVLNILNDGYDGLKDNATKQSFFDTEFLTYGFHFRAENNYIEQVVHSLWVEKNKIVPWSLKDYSLTEIAQLFWNDNLNVGINPPTSLANNLYTNEYPPLESSMPTIKLFLLAKELLKKEGQLQTIKSLITWEKKNFLHAYYDYGWDVYRDGRPDNEANILADGSHIFKPASLERLFEERITGCHEPTLFLTESLRSLNIPAVGIDRLGHAVSYLPTIDKYVHGDLVVDWSQPASA